MRCPKCQYIGFDSVDRCRNCGYEFALSAEDAPLDVTIAREEPAPGRIDHLSLSAFDTPLTPGGTPGSGERAGSSSAARRPLAASDLPLFTERVADDQAPLVTPPAEPRPPLSVRRAIPSARDRGQAPRPEELSLGLASGRDRSAAGRIGPDDARGAAADAAGLARRICAGLIDLSVLGPIAAAVVYLTLRLCELTVDQWRVLPLVPLLTFLLLLCGGYFVLFTAAGGQTIGKMLAKIRVVAAPEGARVRARVSFNTALIRSVACLGSVVALGTGFLPALFSADRRAFHDRVAETRVVAA